MSHHNTFLCVQSMNLDKPRHLHDNTLNRMENISIPQNVPACPFPANLSRGTTDLLSPFLHFAYSRTVTSVESYSTCPSVSGIFLLRITFLRFTVPLHVSVIHSGPLFKCWELRQHPTTHRGLMFLSEQSAGFPGASGPTEAPLQAAELRGGSGTPTLREPLG